MATIIIIDNHYQLERCCIQEQHAAADNHPFCWRTYSTACEVHSLSVSLCAHHILSCQQWRTCMCSSHLMVSQVFSHEAETWLDQSRVHDGTELMNPSCLSALTKLMLNTQETAAKNINYNKKKSRLTRPSSNQRRIIYFVVSPTYVHIS